MIRYSIRNSWLEDSLYFYFLLHPVKIIFGLLTGCGRWAKDIVGKNINTFFWIFKLQRVVMPGYSNLFRQK